MGDGVRLLEPCVRLRGLGRERGGGEIRRAVGALVLHHHDDDVVELRHGRPGLGCGRGLGVCGRDGEPRGGEHGAPRQAPGRSRACAWYEVQGRRHARSMRETTPAVEREARIAPLFRLRDTLSLPMFPNFVPTAHDLRALVKLAVPIVSAQVGVMLMGVVDTIVVGHVSARELAAASLGHMYVFGLAIFAMGTLWAIDPIVSQAAGAKDHEGVALGVQRGLALAVGIGAVLTVLCLPADHVFRWLRQPPDVVPRAAAFVWFSAPSMIVLLMWATLRQSLQALKQTRAIVITIVAGNLLNLALNWVFVFGNLGSPAMGAPGSALGSTIGRWLMLALLLTLSRRQLKGVLRPWRPEALRREALLRTLRLGLPIGIQSSVEFTTFASIS